MNIPTRGMRTKVQKWGNCLGVRIPRSFAAEARLDAGSTVDISLEKGSLRIRPVRRRRYALGELVRKITRRNLHEEVATGAPVGREWWIRKGSLTGRRTVIDTSAPGVS